MGHFTTSDGLRLKFTDTGGEGLPLLCLSGLTRSGADFDDMAPHLAPRRIVTLDYRGRGGSDHGRPEDYTVPREARDVVELLDHLTLDRVAVLGTSRGGIVAMMLAASGPAVKARLAGVALNDIGPEMAPEGLALIAEYIGRAPRWRSHAEAAAALAAAGPSLGFDGVPEARWRAEAERLYPAREGALGLDYDPALREAVLAAMAGGPADLWPLFEALSGLPLALIRGAGSNLLTRETAAEMRARRPDMIFAEVPGRGHIPFLDEPEALAALRDWLAAVEAGGLVTGGAR